MNTATTTSTRRDGRTAATVSDDRVRELVRAVRAAERRLGVAR